MVEAKRGIREFQMLWWRDGRLRGSGRTTTDRRVLLGGSDSAGVGVDAGMKKKSIENLQRVCCLVAETWTGIS
jgi:hypothetical protein